MVRILVIVFVAFLMLPFIHIDHYYGSYGVSLGDDTHYCSYVYPNGFSCEEAR